MYTISFQTFQNFPDRFSLVLFCLVRSWAGHILGCLSSNNHIVIVPAETIAYASIVPSRSQLPETGTISVPCTVRRPDAWLQLDRVERKRYDNPIKNLLIIVRNWSSFASPILIDYQLRLKSDETNSRSGFWRDSFARYSEVDAKISNKRKILALLANLEANFRA